MAKITIPVITPSLNELLRMNPHARTRLKDSFKSHIEGALHDMGMRVTKMRKPRKRDVIIRSFRKRLLDTDNFVGGCKSLLDSINEIGLIWDDSPEHICVLYQQLRDKHDIRTEVFIDEI